MIWLKRPTGSDREWLYWARINPHWASVAANGREITYSDHLRWWDSGPHDLWMVMRDGKRVGMVELERKHGLDVSISVGVISEECRKGIGPEAIKMACTMAKQEWPGCSVVADIAPDNWRSRSAFTKAGFGADPTGSPEFRRWVL